MLNGITKPILTQKDNALFSIYSVEKFGTVGFAFRVLYYSNSAFQIKECNKEKRKIFLIHYK